MAHTFNPCLQEAFLCEFEDRLVYIVSYRIVRATYSNPLSKQTNKKQKENNLKKIKKS